MRIKFIMLITSLVMMVGYSFGQDEENLTYTLQECIEYALENHPDIKVAVYDMEIADTEISNILSQGLPQANVSLGVNYNFRPQQSIIDLGAFDPNVPEGTEEEVSFQQQYDGNLILGASQLLFDASFFLGFQAAKVFKELSYKDHLKTQIDVIEAVSKAYYNVLVTRERYDLLEANYARIDSLLKDTRLLYKNGFVEEIDVSRLKVQHNNLQVDVRQTKELLKIAHNLLQFQMGMPVTNDIRLKDSLKDVLVDLNFSENYSYGQRIEYSRLHTVRNLIGLDIRTQKSKYLPSLYANFGYGYNTQTSRRDQWFQTNRWLNYGFIGLSLDIPVFDGFRKRSLIQKSKIEAKQINQSFRLLENTIDLEVKQARVDLSNAVENMAIQKENMKLAEEIYHVTKLKYKEGVGSNMEVIEADTDFKESQTNYYDALYDALVARIELRKAYGLLNK